MEFVIPLEIDFEIGPNLRDTKDWTYSYTDLYTIISDSIDLQVKDLGYDIDKDAVLYTIFESKDSIEQMPDWLRNQRNALKEKGKLKALPSLTKQKPLKKKGKKCQN